jgi:hypothetical protein
VASINMVNIKSHTNKMKYKKYVGTVPKSDRKIVGTVPKI